MKLELLQVNVNESKNSSHGGSTYTNIGLFVDSETGVEYFVINCTDAGAITPRLDRDGKPYIYKK